MLIPCILCVDCVHLDLINKVNGKSICKAFPEGIPDEVIKEKSTTDIDKIKPCNNGIGFEYRRNDKGK